MAKTITFEQQEIKKLFGNFYKIPDYQREYVWQEENVSQLLNDIYDNFDHNPKAEYYLGSIVVCKGKEDTTKFEVIDGQQRLITLSLMINNFLKLSTDSSTLNRLLYDETINLDGKVIRSPKVEIHYEGKNVFYDLCNNLLPEDEIDLKSIEGLPGKTIFDAHKTIRLFFEQNFKGNETEKRNRFMGYFLNNVILIQIETPEIGNALKIFETINQRGVSLDHVDLLKNLLFQHVSRSDFQKLKEEWQKFKESITGHQKSEKPLRFLRYFIMSNYEIDKDDKGDKILREDEIYSWLVKNEKRLNYKADTFSFVRRIQENAEFYMDVIKHRHNDQANVNLENIYNLVGSGFKQHFILLLSAKSLKPEQFDHLLKQLETLLFYYNITKEPPRDVEKRFASWTEEIRKIKSNQDLNDFIQNQIQADLDSRSRSYEINFKSLRYSSMQKYKLKYLLAKLSQYVEIQRTGDESDRSIMPYLRQSIHIEHILPEDPTSEIIKDFSKGNKTEYLDYVTRLGNLTLLEATINTSIQRDYFASKVKEYPKSNIYLTKSIAKLENVGSNTSINRINSQLSSFTKWGKSEIEKRHNMLLELSRNVWKTETL